ncbi:iron-containing alcohol dehydrogenase [Thermodesulfobacteriota bacterium]
MRFEFATATRIIFGHGTIKNTGSIVEKMGRRAFVITGRSLERAKPLIGKLKDTGMEVTQFSIPEEPTTQLALAAVEEARRQTCDMVIGIGGGSVLDTGKVVAALLTNSGQLMDYLEVIGPGQPLKRKSAPFVAIPTTAGTGTEVTSNSVLESPEHRVKVSMRSPYMLPDLALIDPELTYSMPCRITAVTGLDAFTQLLEAFVSVHANPMTDGICREGLQRAALSLKRVYLNGEDVAARRDMCLASLFGGLALANAKLGAVHGFAGPLGGMYHAAHGALCAGLLPFVMEANIKALQSRASDSPALDRYDEVARLITGLPAARAADGIAWVRNLCVQLEIKPLAAYGIEEKDFADIVINARTASSMKGNPIELTKGELLETLHNAL